MNCRVKPAVLALVMLLTLSSMSVVSLSVGPAAGAQQIKEIVFPVHPGHMDRVYWGDTYGAPRGGGRSHLGVDIMGPKMVPLVAAADGTITWMRHGPENNPNAGGSSSLGNNITITGDDGWKYHYVHLNNDTPGTDDGANRFEEAFAPGMKKGVRVKAGQLIGYLGDSGNAENTAPHLHFEIESPSGYINPTPSVNLAATRVRLPEIAPQHLGPFDNTVDLTTTVYSSLLGRTPTSAEMADLADKINAQGLIAGISAFISPNGVVGQVDRLYVSFFRRHPDEGGLRYWVERHGAGVSLEDIADYFAQGEEFRIRYGNLSFDQFLDLLYRDVLSRNPDPEGTAYWMGELNSGRVNRGTIIVYFSEGQELIGRTGNRSELMALSLLFGTGIPDAAAVENWSEQRARLDLAPLANSQFLVRN